MRKTFFKGIAVTALASVLTVSGSLCAFAASNVTYSDFAFCSVTASDYTAQGAISSDIVCDMQISGYGRYIDVWACTGRDNFSGGEDQSYGSGAFVYNNDRCYTYAYSEFEAWGNTGEHMNRLSMDVFN